MIPIFGCCQLSILCGSFLMVRSCCLEQHRQNSRFISMFLIVWCIKFRINCNQL